MLVMLCLIGTSADGCFRVLALVAAAAACIWAVVGASSPTDMAAANSTTGTTYITNEELEYLQKTTVGNLADGAEEGGAQKHGSSTGARKRRGFVEGVMLLVQSPAALATVLVQLSCNWTHMTLELYSQ